MNKFSRRDFLKLAGSSIALGAMGNKVPQIFRNQEVVNNLDKFDHVVVLMMENRSFDNMLGYLYTPQNPPPNGQSFEGVAFGNHTNPIPPYADSAKFVDSIRTYPDSIMNNPNPDPGETYPHINTQLFGTVIPDTNRFLTTYNMFSPYNEPDPLPENIPMDGFIKDYINNFRATQGRMPTYSEYKIIMSCFPPTAVPVISQLAKSFAVCDNWHCAVPSQTFCNRAFFNCGSSWGYVNNEPYEKWLLNFQETIFERLENNGHSWRIYFDHKDIIPLTLLIHFPRLIKYASTNICNFENFERDVEKGLLPKYSFIEPRLIFFHNDEHPPAPLIGNIVLPSSVLPGEQLISKVYNAIRNSSSSKGNNWKNTLLIVTYDEHGGCYDHIPPPAAEPPYVFQPNTEMNFKFNRLGVRVPAVFISAYIKGGTVFNEQMTHTSVIKTMCDKWNLGHLTNRDLTSPSFVNIFNSTAARPQEDWPITIPRESEIEADKDYFLCEDLAPLQMDIIKLANAAAYGNQGLPPGINAVEDGLDFLKEVKKVLKISYSCE
jgi:phospholipase C